MYERAVRSERKSGLLETVRTIIYAVVIALVVRSFLFEPFNIPSGSMKPTLLVGDYLFVSKYAYGYSRYSLPLGLPLFEGRIFGSLPERGDVAVFKLPADNRTDYIKRIVGLPGDRIQVKDGRLFINDEPVAVQPDGEFVDDGAPPVPVYLETLPTGVRHMILDLNPRGALDNTGVFVVPAGHVFAMGDNRDNSQDSRVAEVGFIPLENLIGRAEVIFFSTNGYARLWEIWKWPFTVRYGRLLNWIR
jgi:signal peptidase I